MLLSGSQPSFMHVATPDSLGNFARLEFFRPLPIVAAPPSLLPVDLREGEGSGAAPISIQSSSLQLGACPNMEK